MDVRAFEGGGKKKERELQPMGDRLASEPEFRFRGAVWDAHDTLVESAR